MRGYPKGPKTKQDFDNLLAMTEHRGRALKELEEIRDLGDDTIQIDETPADAKPEDERIIKIVENPMPLYKSLGFADKEDIAAAIDCAKGEIKESAPEVVING